MPTPTGNSTIGTAPSVSSEVSEAAQSGLAFHSFSRSFSEALVVEDHWSSMRAFLGYLIHSKKMDVAVAATTMLNLCFVIVQTDLDASGDQIDDHVWVRIMSMCTLSFFTFESACRVFVHRMMIFHNNFYILDIVVSTLDLLMFFIEWGSVIDFVPMLSLLRFWRITRLLNVVLKMQQFRELYMMVHGLLGALRAILWATVILGCTLLFCSVFAVQIIHPLNKEIAARGVYDDCERCPNAYASVWQSTLTFVQQIIAGDSWGLVTLPVIEAYPLSAAFFIPVFLTIDLALMNLVLMVVIDQAEEARLNDTKRVLADKDASLQKAKDELTALCAQLDTDESGCLSFSEVIAGAKKNNDFQDLLRLMDIGPSDLETVFSIMDVDESGTVEYPEFCNQLHKMKTDDMHTMLVLMRHQMKLMRADVKAQLAFHKQELDLEMQQMKLLKEDYMTKFVEIESLLRRLLHSGETSRLENPEQGIVCGLGASEAKASSSVSVELNQLSLPKAITKPSPSPIDAQLLDLNDIALQISHLKLWVSQELPPILRSELEPLFRGESSRLSQEVQQRFPAASWETAATSSSAAPPNPWTCGDCRTPPKTQISRILPDPTPDLGNKNKGDAPGIIKECS